MYWLLIIGRVELEESARYWVVSRLFERQNQRISDWKWRTQVFDLYYHRERVIELKEDNIKIKREVIEIEKDW